MHSTQPKATVPFTILNIGLITSSHPDQPDLYRIRIQPADKNDTPVPTVKYLTAPHTRQAPIGPYAQARRHNDLAFEKVPAGDWVVGNLAPGKPDVDGNDGKLELVSTETDTKAALEDLGMRSAEPVWCGTIIDEQDCRDDPAVPYLTNTITTDGTEVIVHKPTELECMDYVSAAVITTPPGVPTDAKEVIRVTDWIPGHWVGIEADARAHQIIQAHEPGLAPRLVAHVTENRGRVVGFLLERVRGTREADVADLGGCRDALARLHALGIAKGQLSRRSFLVREDGSVTIHGPFTGNFGDEEIIKENMDTEMKSLDEALSRRPSILEDSAAARLNLVDSGRRKLLEEFEKAHGFIVPFVYWQESGEGGGRITLTVEQHGVLAEEFRQNGFSWTEGLQKRAERRFGPALEAVSGQRSLERNSR